MDKIKESPHIVRGLKSWLHCIELKLDNVDENSNLCHYHDYIEILYSRETNDRIYIDEKYYKFSSGDLVIINPGVPHKVFHNNHSDYVCIKFSPDVLYADDKSLFEFKYVLPFVSENSHSKIYYKDQIENSHIPQIIHSIIDEWNEEKPGYELMAKAGILRLFGELIRYFEHGQADAEIPDAIKSAISYISENYATANEKDVAEKCAMSYSHFSRIFKNVMNQNFKDYLIAVKLREAEKLLVTTEKTVTEIAYETGFSTASHFISLFKKYKHISPKQYKINYRTSMHP
ncbi:MAG: helix-turn-helix transcriptional regulator [Oscillospiraceae bacterium]|nr:helix-turn-helix transcriptional regulator [Oscillospiraceae bacterium]